MSVVKSWQKPTDLIVLNKCADLVDYTHGIVMRKKTVSVNGEKTKELVFPKKDWNWFTSQLLAYAIGAYDLIFMANEIQLDENTEEEEYSERKALQRRAKRYLLTLQARIYYAWRKFGIREDSVDYWGSLVSEVIDLLIGWQSSDKKRYASFRKKREGET